MTDLPERLQLRADTEANWTAVNPVLGLNEPAKETDTGRLKIGDGVTPWNELPAYLDETGLSAAYVGQDVVDTGRLSEGALSATLVPRAELDDPTSAARAALNDAYARPTDIPIPGRGVVVFTWDDGHASDMLVAQAARERGQAHTFFMIPSTLDTAGSVTSAEVTEIADMGHEIGHHGSTDYRTLSVAERVTEYDSAATLEALAGKSITSLAYPFGQRNATIDQETALRFHRTLIVGDVSRPWRQQINTLRSHNVNRLTWTSATHEVVLQAIRSAAFQDTLTVIMGHEVGTSPAEITEAELIEALDLARDLNIRCMTAQDALPYSNRLIDPGFELGTLGAWDVTGDAASVVDTPHDGLGGARSLKLTRAGAPNPEVIQGVPVDVLEPYTLSGRYRSNQATGYTKLLLRCLDVNAANVGDTAINLGVPMPSWTRFTREITPPVGTIAIQVFAWLETDGEAYLDHLWLSPSTQGAFG